MYFIQFTFYFNPSFNFGLVSPQKRLKFLIVGLQKKNF